MSSRFPIRTLATILWGVVWLAMPHATRADSPGGLDAAVLKKVKAATVHLEVSLPSGSTVEGSGFFVDEPGLVLTNAHVLWMLDADSRPPLKVAVTINSGETDSRTVTAKLLGVDRGSDLALLRVEGKDLPESLKVVPAKDLKETEEVFIFGFPLGKRLGTNITVSKSSVSSLRKENGRLKEVQVNGGIHPGNSGGPVANAKGEVVGISVSAIRGTALNFAIPGEMAYEFLNGRITEQSVVLGYKDGDKIKMEFRVAVVDPLGRIKKIALETWTGDVGTRRRVELKTLPGDSEHQTVPVKYTKQSPVVVELTMPALEDAKQGHWIRTTYVNGGGYQVYFPALSPNMGAPVERKTITLAYKPKLDHERQAELTREGTFRILLEGEEHSIGLNLKTTLTEHTAAKAVGTTTPILVGSKSLTFNILEDKKRIETGEDLERDIKNARFLSANVEMGADGAVVRSKGDLSNVPKESRGFVDSVSDEILQALEVVGVPLPEGEVKPLQSWKTERIVLIGNALVGVPAKAEIKYIYIGTRQQNGRECAVLDVQGTVKGVRGAGLNLGGKVNGLSSVALDTGEVLDATLTFKSDMDVEYKKKKAKVYGELKVHVRRDVPAPTKP